MAQQLSETSLRLYKVAADYARMRGIIIADTKFEFGLDEGNNLLLADEVLTPDSSRFWDVEQYTPGRAQDSFDKQFVRDYLESINWNKEPPAPELPEEVVARTREKYLEAYQRFGRQAAGIGLLQRRHGNVTMRGMPDDFAVDQVAAPAVTDA